MLLATFVPAPMIATITATVSMELAVVLLVTQGWIAPFEAVQTTARATELVTSTCVNVMRVTLVSIVH